MGSPLHGYGVSFGSDEKILELDNGDGYIHCDYT